jgi:hypothetical protein
MFAKDLNSDLYEKKLNFKAFPDSLEQFNLNGHSKSNFYPQVISNILRLENLTVQKWMRTSFFTF